MRHQAEGIAKLAGGRFESGSRPCLTDEERYKSMMQQMVSWKFWLIIGVSGFSLGGVPSWAQTPASPTTPDGGTDAKSYVSYGISSGAQGDLDGATAAFNRAIKVDPKYAPAYFYLGKVKSIQTKLDDAISAYNQAIQLDPKYKDAYFQRGSIYGEKGDFDHALNDFKEVINLDPKYAQAYYDSGHVLYFTGDLDGATKELDQAISLDPNYSYSYYIRGLVLHAQGDPKALFDFRKSSQPGLDFAYAAFWVWICEMESGQHGIAAKDLSDALAKPSLFKPGDWPSQIGNFLEGNLTQDQLIAKSKTTNDLETAGRLCEAWFYAGMSSRLSGDSKTAIDSFTKAIATGSRGSEEYVEANRELTELKKQ
jgi:lipoprotein NlpI